MHWRVLERNRHAHVRTVAALHHDASSCWRRRLWDVSIEVVRKSGRRVRARAEAVVAAGGLRRPPTKSPNRIPFGFQASLHRVNNVFTRRFGSFAVGRASPPPPFSGRSSAGPTLLYRLPPSCVPHRGPFSFFPHRSPPSMRAVCGRAGRPACCTFHGCLQLRIMNIDNSAGREERPTIVPMSISQRPLRDSLAIRADSLLRLLRKRRDHARFLPPFFSSDPA